MQTVHKTVLLKETIDGLQLHTDSVGVVVDGTFGGGGHSLEILERYPGVRVVAIDADKGAWGKAEHKFGHLKNRLTFINGNFRDMRVILKGQEVDEVLGVVLDLGLSSDQLENAERGFTFQKDEPLYMTMKENPDENDVTAKDIVNTWSEETLADIIYGYGEEKFARRIAKAIVEVRESKEINTTFELVEVIRSAVPARYTKEKLHFATRTFQALRIAVNDELGALSDGLKGGFEILKSGGRMSVISFHSLEDRIVKNFYKEKVAEGQAIFPPKADQPQAGVNKKPIIAGDKEAKDNKRSRSAKLRIIEKK